jgi:hydrogenase nickel incorporation protein HypA/HybF
MHELSIAASIVESILEFAQTYPTRRVLEVRVAVGELTCVELEQLRFCYESVTKETLIEDSTLAVERADASVNCPHCGYSGRPKYWDNVATLQCPSCGQAAEAVTGHECAIKGIKYANG